MVIKPHILELKGMARLTDTAKPGRSQCHFIGWAALLERVRSCRTGWKPMRIWQHKLCGRDITLRSIALRTGGPRVSAKGVCVSRLAGRSQAFGRSCKML